MTKNKLRIVEQKKNNNEDVLIDDIEEVKMGKISAQIYREYICGRYYERYQIDYNIERHENDK